MSSTGERTLPPPPPSRLTTHQAERSQLIDIVKGLAIILVALGHTNQGELARGWWKGNSCSVYLNVFVYSFHMPAFFFISGALLPLSLARRSRRGAIEQRARTLLYPFLVWSILLPIATAAIALFTPMRPLSLHAVLLNLVTGNTAWFLPALFLTLVFAILTYHRLPTAMFFPLACLASLFCPPTHILAIDRAVEYLPYVVAGTALSRALPNLQHIPARLSLALATLLFTALFLATSTVQNPKLIHFGQLPAAFTGTTALLLLGRFMVGTRLGRSIGLCGVASLWIFLLSPFPQGAARAILLGLHYVNPVVQLCLPTFAAVAIPMWLYGQRYRLQIAWLFVLPDSRSATSTGN